MKYFMFNIPMRMIISVYNRVRPSLAMQNGELFDHMLSHEFYIHIYFYLYQWEWFYVCM